MRPVICPVLASSFKPSGNPSALNAMGRSPVAAMVKRNGWPGRTPNTLAPLMRGVGGGLGVRMMAGSALVEGVELVEGAVASWACASAAKTSVRPQRAVAMLGERILLFSIAARG